MLFESERLISMDQVTAKDAKRGEVLDRVRAGKCLIAGCQHETDRRGLCNQHYLVFIRTKKQFPMKERVRWEAAAIEEGLILAPGAIRVLTTPNPFANV